MNLDAYFQRIGFTDDARPDRPTLEALMRAHLLSVPFENLDQQLRRPVTTLVKDAYSKIVERSRGGWCFEMNGLFAWALTEIGFTVHSLAAHVMRDGLPTRDSPATHKLLLVECGEPLIVDVGFGGGLFAPVPLAPVEEAQRPYQIGITQEDEGYWRFTEQANGSSTSFDFRDDPVAGTYFDETSERLQTDENSAFRRTLTAQRRFADRHLVLRGRLLNIIREGETVERLIPSAGALVSCLREDFGLDMPEVAGLWPQIEARHRALFAS